MQRTGQDEGPHLRAHAGASPVLGRDVYVDRQACVIGRVTLGDESSVWPMAVLRGDVHSIRVGARTSVQDGSVLHVTQEREAAAGYPLVVGDEVTIGHRVVLHGCRIGNRCLIGMGAIVLDGAEVDDEVIIAAGSVVPPRARVTGGALWLGSPARRARDLTPAERAFFAQAAQHYVRLQATYRMIAGC